MKWIFHRKNVDEKWNFMPWKLFKQIVPSGSGSSYHVCMLSCFETFEEIALREKIYENFSFSILSQPTHPSARLSFHLFWMKIIGDFGENPDNYNNRVDKKPKSAKWWQTGKREHWRGESYTWKSSYMCGDSAERYQKREKRIVCGIEQKLFPKPIFLSCNMFEEFWRYEMSFSS